MQERLIWCADALDHGHQGLLGGDVHNLGGTKKDLLKRYYQKDTFGTPPRNRSHF